MNITSITVTYNEDSHLDECLNALKFCKENIIIDLGSTDNSLKIAQKHKCTIYNHKRVQVVEEIKEWAVNKSKTDWVIFIDPDEIFREEYISIISAKQKTVSNLGSIAIPRQNYYMGEIVKFGRWGGIEYYPRIFNKNAFDYTPEVHRGTKLKKQFREIKIRNVKPFKHYWIDSEKQFYEKHKRYIKLEGKSRYNSGMRYGIKSYLELVFSISLWIIYKRALFDLNTGIPLLKLAIWYDLEAIKSLKKYESSKK